MVFPSEVVRPHMIALTNPAVEGCTLPPLRRFCTLAGQNRAGSAAGPMPEDLTQTILLRLAAFVVDALLMALLLIIPGTVISYVAAQFGGSSKVVSLVWWVALAILLLGILLRDGRHGRSLGKRLFGLKIETPNGKPCGYLRSLVRNSTLLLLPIELMFVLNRNSPRLGDRLAKTVVVEE